MNYNKLCVVKLFLIDLNSFELKYYPFITRLDKLNESINSVDDLCTIIWLPSKTKDMNVKVFNIIRYRTEKNMYWSNIFHMITTSLNSNHRQKCL